MHDPGPQQSKPGGQHEPAQSEYPAGQESQGTPDMTENWSYLTLMQDIA